MKTIALLPVKNEAWILPTSLHSLSQLTDTIIALDDGSTDSSRKILEQYNAHIIHMPVETKNKFSMSLRRKRLLEEGRKFGGTHFIWLDADEAFTTPFITNAHEILSSLKPGQKLSMQWLALWKNPYVYKDDASVWSNNYKDFIVCDDPTQEFDDRVLSEARTPGPNNPENIITVPKEFGAVLHFQFVPWLRYQMKQAWYRCIELINAPKKAFNINQIYTITLDDPNTKVSLVPQDWLKDLPIPSQVTNIPPAWHLQEIVRMFDQHTITFFEPLQIWHIEPLHNEFVKQVGRVPKPHIKPPLSIQIKQKINLCIPKPIKNKIKQMLRRRENHAV